MTKQVVPFDVMFTCNVMEIMCMDNCHALYYVYYTEDDLLCDMMEEAQTQVRLNCSLVQNVCRRVVKFLEIELW